MTRQRQSFPECENLCIIGGETIDEKAAIDWLERQEKRRLFLVDCDSRPKHQRVLAYGASSLIEQKIAANEIGWSAVMQPLEIRAAEGYEAIESRVRESHLAARLLLSMVSDLGIRAFSNARENWKKLGPFAPLSSLKDCMKGTPAIVAGAGPSLEEALPTLNEISSRALLIGSGTALSIFSKKGIEPHLACALDSRTPAEFMRSAAGVIACVQSKLNPQAMAEIRGTKILAPQGGPLPWESWWLGEQEMIDSGNTVGNFAAQIAVYFGCRPIIYVGLDLCYRGEVKYAEKHQQERFELIETQNRKGEIVLTQHDWLMAARSHRNLAAEYAERRWISTAQAGLHLGEHVEVLSWEEACLFLNREVNIKERLAAAVQAAPEIKIDEKKESEWQESIERSLLACRRSEEVLLREEPVYRFYLAPLWHLWLPVFRRESQKEDDLQRSRLLFFEKALVALRYIR